MKSARRGMSTNHEYDNGRSGSVLALCVQTSEANVTFAVNPVLMRIGPRNLNPDFLRSWSFLQTIHHCHILLQWFSVSFLAEIQRYLQETSVKTESSTSGTVSFKQTLHKCFFWTEKKVTKMFQKQLTNLFYPEITNFVHKYSSWNSL